MRGAGRCRREWRTKRAATGKAGCGLEAWVGVAIVTVLALSACSGGSGVTTVRVTSQSADAWHAARGAHVSLVPVLGAGVAGWCMQTTSRTVTAGLVSSGRSCPAPHTTRGPIFAESCQGTSRSGALVFALTTGAVASVSIAGGARVRTVTNATLPNGLRAVALQAPDTEPRLGFFRHCPTVTPYDTSGNAIRANAGRGQPLLIRMPRKNWEHPERTPRGVCELETTKLRLGTVAWEGAVATKIGPAGGLLGRPLVSCARTVYVHSGGHYVTAAVLLDASHPGAQPPSLPGSKPLAGHRAVFEAQSSDGRIVARRVPGAWIVASEETPEGLAVPIEMLEHTRVSIHQ